MTNDARYEAILRRIQKLKAQEAQKPRQDKLAAALDAVNALGFLESVLKPAPRGMNGYGPRVIARVKRINITLPEADLSPDAPHWLCAATWYKPKGYGQYETLKLLGIWAVENGEAVTLIVGAKELAFTAPIFNPESYYRHLKHDFHVYYEAEPSPPAPDEPQSGVVLYQTIFDLTQRLALRETIETTLHDWRKSNAYIPPASTTD